jgi:hypothetical protein
MASRINLTTQEDSSIKYREPPVDSITPGKTGEM